MLMDSEIAAVKEIMLELRYPERAPAYFSSLAHRLRVLDAATLADRLDDAVDAGRLAPDEREAVLRADLVLTGCRREDQGDVYLLAEISCRVEPDDVDRAAERAALLGKLGRPAIPVVAGREITAEATLLASERGVWAVLDGLVVSTPGLRRPPPEAN
jgi:hypothetical protein